MTVPVGADGALGLYSAVGDAFADRRIGFGRRRANVAARFARFRGADEHAVAVAWIAGALAEVGLVRVVAPHDASPRTRALLFADMPLHGAHLAAAVRGVPREAADAIRWHREHDDGTGVPDGLRWDGIPTGAAGVGIAHAFVTAIEDAAEPRDPLEALFALTADAGRRFSLDVERAFRAFVHEQPDVEAPCTVTLPDIEDDAAADALLVAIDDRDERTRGTSARLAARAAALAERVGLDAVRASRCARLLTLGRATEFAPSDDVDPLSRVAREQRTALAGRAGAIAAAVPRYASEASALAASAAWYEEGARDRYGALLATVVAAESLDPVEAPRRLAAAAGSQLDPEIARAYVAALGAPT